MHRKRLKRYDDSGHAHHLTFSCFKQRPFLKDDWACKILAKVILRTKERCDLHIWAYVFMPEHVHLLVWPTTEDYSISRFLKLMKGTASREVIGHVKRKNPLKLKLFESGQKKEPYHFWMPGGGFDRNVIKREIIVYTVEYIHNNPVRRGLVENPVDWKWSSAREWESPGSGPITVDRESFPVI